MGNLTLASSSLAPRWFRCRNLIAPLHQGQPEIHRQATAGAMLRLRDAGVLVRNSTISVPRNRLRKRGVFERGDQNHKVSPENALNVSQNPFLIEASHKIRARLSFERGMAIKRTKAAREKRQLRPVAPKGSRSCPSRWCKLEWSLRWPLVRRPCGGSLPDRRRSAAV